MLKWILVVLGVLLLVLVGGAALVATNLDAYLERNRDWLAAQAEAAVGRPVRFDRIGVTFFGGLGVSISQLSVADDPAFSNEPFLTADEVMVVVRLWPALQGRYEVDRVALIEPNIHLIQKASGNNTDSLGQSPTEPTSPTPAPAPPSDAPAPMIAIALADIRDGRVEWIDARGADPLELRVEQLDLEVTDLDLSRPISIDLSAAVLASTTQNLRVTGRAGPLDPDAPAAAPLDLEVSLEGLQMQALAASPLAGSLPPELRFDGPIDVRTKVAGHTGELGVRASVDATSAAVRYESQLDKPARTPLVLEVEGTLYDDRFELASSTLRLDRATLATRGRVGLGESISYDLNVSSEDLPLDGWDAVLPATAGLGLAGNASPQLRVVGDTAREGLPALDGTVSLERFGAQLEGLPSIAKLSSVIALADGGARMPRSSFELGGAPATLAASIADLAKPVVVFEFAAPALTGTALGLERDSGIEALRDVSIAGEASSPDSGPRAKARLRSGSGRASGLDYQQLDAELRYADSILTLDRVDLQAYQGKINGSGRYDLRNADDPRFDVKATLRGLSLQQLSAGLYPQSGDALQGKLDTDIDLAGRSATSDLLRSSLSGNTRIEIAEGVLKDVNLAESALQAVTGVPGLSTMISPSVRTKYPGVFSTGDTIFQTLRGLFEVRDGQLRVNDMNLAAKDYGLKAGGSVGLDGSLNLLGTLNTSRELTQSLIGASKTVRYVTGPSGQLEIPMKVGGTLSSPKTQPDVSALTNRAAQNAASTALSDLINKKLGGKQQDAGSPDATQDPTPDGQTPQPPPEQKPPSDPLQDLIRRGLEGRF